MGILENLFKSDEEIEAEKLAQDYGALQENIARGEGAKEDEAWQRTFEKLKQAGYHPGAASIPQVNDMGTISPITGKGSGYQAPSELERWKTQIDGMMKSGNPVLQQKGLEMINAYQQRVSTPQSKPRSTPAAILEYQYAVHNDGYEGSFADWKQLQKSGTTVNIGAEKDLDKRVKESDLKNYKLPEGKSLPIAPTYRELRDLGAVYSPSQSSDAAGRLAMLGTATQLFPLLDSFIIPDDGVVNEKVLDGAFYLGLDPTPGKAIATKALASIGGYTSAELEQAKQAAQAFEMGFQAITRTETGAAMPQEEIQNTKARFQPLPTDSPAVKRQRYLAYKYFIENATNMMDPSVQRSGSEAQLTAEVNRAANEALKKFNVTGSSTKSPAQTADEEAGYDFGE